MHRYEATLCLTDEGQLQVSYEVDVPGAQSAGNASRRAQDRSSVSVRLIHADCR
jgi:hypothetical protein